MERRRKSSVGWRGEGQLIEYGEEKEVKFKVERRKGSVGWRERMIM